MPVIVVGADTPAGRAVVEALTPRPGEVRAFVSDPVVAEALRARGVKVAVGDVSDASHLEGAAADAFCAVLLVEAARDGRERAFAPDEAGVVAAWAEAIVAAGVRRAIWVGLDAPPRPRTAELALIDAFREDLAAEIARLEDAEELPGPPV